MAIPKYIIPGKTKNDEWILHKNRYEFACKHVKGKVVLDAACGAGYGSQMMLDAGAKKVVGIDLDKSAISYARSHYKADFILMDMTDTEFENNYFDMFVCFAAMGAVDDVQQFFGEVKRLLKPGGIFIVSAGVFGKSFLENKRLTRLASHHFTKDGLITIFKKNFTDVKFYAQEKQFFAFPGRGIINKILGIRRDHSIVPLNNISNPRAMVCIGKPIK